MRKFLVAILLILTLSTCILPAFAADNFDFQPYINTFVSDSFHDIELKVGETHKANGAVWIGANRGGAYSSNESVVIVNGGGQVTAVGEGTAYVVIVAPTGMSATTRYTVVRKTFFNSFKLQNIMFLIVPGFILMVFMITLISLLKANRGITGFAGFTGNASALSRALSQAGNNPCQQTADALLHTLDTMDAKYRATLAANSNRNGTPFYNRIRNSFNTLNSCPNVTTETKTRIRGHLIALNAYGLDSVKASPVHQTPEEARAAWEAFGKGGEDNVWHSLKSLPDFGTYDVFRDVRIDGTENSNQIDAVVLSETGGIFLLEVKSVGGQKDKSGVRVVSLDQLKEDPTNQILRHRAAFLRLFEQSIPGNDSVHDLLVFSYPHGSERRVINKDSFRGNPYDVVSVERLLAYFTAQKGATLTPAQRQHLAQQLVAYCNDFALSNL